MNAETSLAAAAMQTPGKRLTDKERIYAALKSSPHGLTRRRIHAATGIKMNTVNGRVAELLAAFLVEIVGEEIEEGSRVGVVAVAAVK